jgi:hypothetical protein
MPWIKEDKFYLAVLLLLIFIMAARTPLDSDMWWHLRAGEETLNSRAVYLVDTLSYTRAGEAWINHSWLAQVLMVGLFKVGEFKALSLWVGLTATLSMFFIYLQMEGHALLRTGVVLLASFVSSVVWSPRPQIISLLLFAITGFIIFRYKTTGKNQLYWLAPIFIIWSNLHGGYVLGTILIIAVIIGEIFDQILGETYEYSLNWGGIGQLAAWGVAGFILAAVNPNGVNMWIIPFQTVGVVSLQNLINEWASPDFHQPIQQLMLVLLFGTFAAVGLSKRRLAGSDLVSMIIFGYLALTARRNFGPFALITAPIYTKHLADLLPGWKNKLEKRWRIFQKAAEFQNKSEKNFNTKYQAYINGGAVLLLIVLAAWKLIYVTDASLIQKTEKQMFPQEAVNWIKEEKPTGRLMNSYNWGGYLAWNLREYPVFVDGRTDLFGDEILIKYVDVMSGHEGWEKVLTEYNVDILFIEADSTIEKIAVKSGWVINYKDPVAVILTKQEIISE